MKKTLLLGACALGITLAACDEEKKKSYPPTYSGFTYSPNPVRPGDSVTISIVQSQKGSYLNAVDYNLNVRLNLSTGKDTTIALSYHTNYDGTDNSDPTFRFLLPATTSSDRATCNFSARWSNSVDGAGGSYGDGSFRSVSYSIYSTASGTFTLPIKQ